MLNLLFPNKYVDSVFSIDFEELFKKGFRGLVFDIDNTLVHHGDDSNEDVDLLFKKLHSIGFRTLLLSNNSEERVNRFLKNIDSLAIPNSGKPKRSAFKKAVSMLDLEKKEVICFGDQIFIDVLGANLSSLTNVLVKFITAPGETYFGKRREAEKIILKLFEKSKKAKRGIVPVSESSEKKKTASKKRKNFCDINPLFWKISTLKGIALRNVRDFSRGVRFAETKSDEKLPNVISHYESVLIKKGPGIDPRTQENKAVNVEIASSKINGIIIRPGETFSFWKLVGKITAKRGYLEGRVIKNGVLVTGVGGGLCNLANTVNNLILHSPLQITEFHKHSDALASDIGHRVPMANGTSVNYNYIDYRFVNNTDQDVQILLWCDEVNSIGELRSEKEIPFRFELSEEGHHFEKEGDEYFRVSKIFKDKIDKESGEVVERELIWNNHSRVMFDPSLIPEDQIQ